MSIIFRYFLTASLVLTLACSHKKLLQGKLDKDRAKLDVHSSFSFMHEDHEYFFSLFNETVEDKTCSYYVGYKDGKLTYRFDSWRFKDLNDIYEKKVSPEERIGLALKGIEEFGRGKLIPTCSQKPDASDSIAWMTVALIFYPVTLLAVGSQIINDATSSLDKVRLNMTLAEMEKMFRNVPMIIRTQQGRKYYIVDDHNQRRVVMYFKDGRLLAYVSGHQPMEVRN